ncbi:MAG: RelA/SpoT family protein, partial [Oscillospiraceae bacterium]|nr:RelA/SpoT family protein [Oscillospiraceae bacterium]
MERKVSDLLVIEFPDDEVTRQYEELESFVAEGNPGINRERLRAAYIFARKYHGEQLRNDGSPYITHPLAAAMIFAKDIMLDEDALVACLLHDVIEDTEVTYKEVERIFGTQAADLVDGVTKLTRIVYTSKDEEQTENIRKTLLATAKDIRVMLIKLADRLHNLRTLDYKSIVKQRDKAAETIEIYAPIAHRLGMQKIKWELEDRSIKYLDPEAVEEIEKFLEEQSATLQEVMRKVREKIEEKLKEENIDAEVQNRLKHLYSIYRKMYSQNKGLREVHDLCAFRVIIDNGADGKTSTTGDCYQVLGVLGTAFHPVPGKYKDYIANPKPNGYRSIHNTYIGKTGILFEIQIRTREMHTNAEYGVAAHWKYKKGGDDGVNANDENQYAWIRDMLGRQEDLDPEQFKSELRAELFADEVMVFTPKGMVVTLPSGATPIDFAYRLHSDIGNHISGAKVNGRIVPIDSKLESGAVIEIMTSNATKGP